jgi:hypothetical protein
VPLDQAFANDRITLLLKIPEEPLDLWFGQGRVPVVAAQ